MFRYLFVIWSLALQLLPGQAEIRYGRDIRPILSDKCFFCHGPDPKTREEDLRLDLRDEAIAGKCLHSRETREKPPHQADQRHRRGRHHASAGESQIPDRRPKNNCCTTGSQAGAEYEPHWAYIAPKRESGQTIDTLVARDLESAGTRLLPTRRSRPPCCGACTST